MLGRTFCPAESSDRDCEELTEHIVSVFCPIFADQTRTHEFAMSSFTHYIGLAIIGVSVCSPLKAHVRPYDGNRY